MDQYVFLNDNLQPVEEADATLVHIIRSNGESVWAKFSEPKHEAVATIHKAASEPTDGPDWEKRVEQEKKTAAIIAKLYDAQASKIKLLIERKSGSDVAGYNEAISGALDDDVAGLAEGVQSTFEDIINDGVDEAVDQLPIDIDWEGRNDAVAELAKRRAQEWAESVSESSEADTMRIISDWFEAGDQSIAELIELVDGVWGGPRADLAAVSSVTDLFAEANIEAWKQSNVVTGYRVRTANDTHVCDWCDPLEGQEFDLDDEENRPSIHVGCRCGVTPVISARAVDDAEDADDSTGDE